MGRCTGCNRRGSDITAENVEEVYPLLYPSRKTVAEVYAQIIGDLNAALEPGGAPAVNVMQFLLTKSVANALLARVYAEKPVRDYAKVIQYVEVAERWLQIGSRFLRSVFLLMMQKPM